MAQDKVAEADFGFHAHVRRDAKLTRTMWWEFKGKAQQTFKERMITKGPKEGYVDSIWVKMVTWFWKVAREVFGVPKGKKHEPKDIWRWNEDLQKEEELLQELASR